MENLIETELIKNSKSVLKKATDLPPSYLTAMNTALLTFEGLGIPSKNNEDWKYTNIASVLSPRFFDQQFDQQFDPKKDNGHAILNNIINQQGMIVFNNGIFNKFLSVLPDGIELDALAIEEKFFDTFDSLNFGVAVSPLSLKIKKNTSIAFPITIIHHVDDNAVNKVVSPRLTITAEENTKAHFLEIFTCSNNAILQYTTNAVTRFILKSSSSIEYVKIQSEAANAVHISLTQAQIFKDSSFKSMNLDFGLLTARQNIDIGLMEAGAYASVHGLFALKKSEHSDVFSTITHFAPHTTSDQLFKGILSGESHGVFTGKIIINKDAQKSSSSQLNKNLILSKKCHIDTRPQLLVHADDVKCSHGATIGQLSKEEEFYLESRGIKKEHAKRMLCHGFAMDVILKIENPSIKKLAEAMLIENFEKTALID